MATFRALQPQPLTRFQFVVVGITGVLFLGIGLAFTGSLFWSGYGIWRTRAEVVAPARLDSVEWKTSGGLRGSSRYTEAAYTYPVGQQTFTGSRISIFKQTASFDSSLEYAYRTGRPVPVYIDPNRPSYSTIDRSFSLWPFCGGVLFAITFAFVGGLMIRRVFQGNPPQRKIGK